MTEECSDNLARLKVAILQETEEASKSGSVLFLSTLGKTISDKFVDFKEIIGDRTLKHFIDEELHEELEVQRDEITPQRIWVKPRGRELPAPRGASTRRVLSSGVPTRRERVIDELWRCFTTSLDDNGQRIIDFSHERPVRREFSTTEELTDKQISIDRDLIVPWVAGDPESVRKGWRSFDTWFERNSAKIKELGFDRSTFVYETPLRVNSALSAHVRSGTVMSFIASLEVLSEEDQKRVIIPVDIIAKLLRNES
ncbi:MAG: hypothetical protein AAGK02_02610 [Pseudomonadota bacterium]